MRAWFARDLAGLLGGSLPAGLAAIPAEASLAETFARAQELEPLPADLDLATAGRRFEVFRANLRRIEGYAGRSYPGGLQLIRAAASHFRDPVDPTLGWAALARGGVEVHEVAGDHWALLRPPALEVVAAALQR